MSTHYFSRLFRQSFKWISTALLLASLLLNSLPLQAARANGAAGHVKSVSKAPLFVPTADLSLSIYPLERVMIGEDFEFYAAFDNSTVDVGYGPFIDLIFPTNGMDGAAGTDTPDGIDFIDADFDGYTLPATSLIFPDDDGAGVGTTGCVSHPLAADATGTPAQVCGTTGDTLVVLELPFSSITQDMPMLYVEINAHVSNLADVDAPLTILGRGGYRYGADNLDNPASDPAILNPTSTDGSGWPDLTVTPRVIHIEKDFDGPKECPYLEPDETVLDKTECPYGYVNPVYESVSGPNFPRHYTINIYVATGQTVTSLDVTDYFPNNIAYVTTTSLGGGTLVDAPIPNVANNAPDNDLIVNFASLSGSTDIVVEFFIPEFDADAVPVLDPVTGASAVADNIATALGDWTPVDTRDPGGPDNAIANGPCPGSCVPLHTLDIRSLAVQKSVAIETDNGVPGYSPGDLLKYTLEFQISDYFTYGDLVLTDVLTDGQHFDNPGGDYPPIFSVSDRNTALVDQSFTYTPPPGATAPGDDLTIDESQIGNTGVPADGTDGSTTLTFDISKAMTNAGEADGVLQGGEAGTTGAVPAIGSVTFYATILEDFTDDYPSADSSVDHGDKLFNRVTVEGTIYDEVTVTATANTQTNDSVQKIKIVYGGLEKDIYAINGSTSFTPEVQPEDTITFRLKQSLPSTDSDNLVLTDFLPLPILDTAEIIAFDNVTSGAVPVAGRAKFGPTNTYTPVPTFSADPANNSLTFDYGSFDDPLDASTEIDILFTLTVSNDPYADGSVLTNLATAEEETTNNGELYHIGTERFTLKEPGISLRKGVVASDNLAAVFVPNPPGPVTFAAPGSAPSWTGTIASTDNDPGTVLIDSDVQSVAAGDLLTFALVIENLGHSTLGAFDISVNDTLPADMVIPAGGINLQVRRGDGAALTHAPVGSTATEASGLFDSGIVFTDESPTQGVTHVYNASNGLNIIVITYDLQIGASVPAATSIVNTATVLSYAGTEGGPNHVGATPSANVNTDDATALTGANVAPVITAGPTAPMTIAEDGTPNTLGLTANDANGNPLTWSILTPATYGTAAVGSGSGVASYAPFHNYNGADSFAVQVSDGQGGTDSVVVNVTVTAVNDPPMTSAESYDVQYNSWYGVSNALAFGGFGYRRSLSGTFAFRPRQPFTQVRLITYRGPNQGRAQILVDGVVKTTVNLYRATPQWQYPIMISGLANTMHTVTVRALNSHVAPSTGNWVAVDGFKIGATNYDDIKIFADNGFAYDAWVTQVESHSFLDGYKIASTANSSIRFSFDGVQLNWTTARGPSYGRAQIYIDGQLKRTVDLYRASQQWQYHVLVSGLAYGHHNVLIKVLGTKNPASSGTGVIADCFEIE